MSEPAPVTELPEGVTPQTVCDLTLKLRLWQTNLNMPVTFRKELMGYLDALWPPHAQAYAQFKARKGSVL